MQTAKFSSNFFSSRYQVYNRDIFAILKLGQPLSILHGYGEYVNNNLHTMSNMR
jgi:hypothetical protein